MLLLRSLLAVLSVCLILAAEVTAKCGYKSCPTLKSNMVNVHLVPHSHDDVGWLKTVDQYYYGSRNYIQHAGVQYIIDNVIAELSKNSQRRFIFVEAAFFFKWWDEQNAEMKKQVRKLVEGGQIEFAGGAHSMNDEAATNYQSLIDQFTIGLKSLSETFGTCGRPKVGWQIDPFGHSREQASIFAQMGYDGQFFARIDWVEKNERFSKKNGEMIWKASQILGESAELFTGVLWNHYSAPPTFCFDVLCSDQPINDGNSYDNNVIERVDTFISYLGNLTTKYRANNLIVPMGDDFNYENAEMNFKNMDKLIKHVNARQARGSKFNIIYSTPSCYLNALHEDKTLTLPTKEQDFFPYSTDGNSYWTGYYSSRPTQKRFERDGNHFLQVTKQLTTLANLTGTTVNDNLNKLSRAMGMMQHHDAITGTEKQHVASDYDRILTDAMNAGAINTRMALQKLTNLTNGEFISCMQLNISVCPFTQKIASADQVVVTLFNPLAHPSKQNVRVPVQNGTYIVTDASGQTVRSQVVPVSREVVALPFRANDSQHELVFAATVKKLENFYVKRSTQPRLYDEELESNRISLPKRFQDANKLKSAFAAASQGRAPGDTVVEFSNIKLTFNVQGRLVSVQMNGVTEQIQQDFYYYRGAAGNNEEFKNRSSGAYIFRPNGTEILIGDKATLTVVEGPLVKEVHQHVNNWISQVIRIYEGSDRVEFEWLVGPIPIQDNIGKEIITRYTSNINSKSIFWTDANGREMMRRVRNEREGFKPNMTERVSGNYYPVTACISIEDQEKRMTLLTDRAQGGTSIKDGTLELMLHRRLLRDDAFGVGEALNETAFGQGLVARGKTYLMLSSQKQKPRIHERQAQKEIHLPLGILFSNAMKAVKKVVPKLPDFSDMPQSMHLLTLEPYSAQERLLRLEHFLNRNESTSVKINLRRMFDGLGGEDIRETTLDGSMPLSDMKRFKFTPDGSKKPSKPEYYTSKHVPLVAKKKDANNKFDVNFEPMQIRTFIIRWK